MKIMLMGYYGYRNIGDDLFVKHLTNFFSKKEAVEKIFLICNDNYYEISSKKISLFRHFQLSKIKRLFLLWQSDYVAWGGGTLDLKSVPKNLSTLQTLAKLLGKRFCFLGIGLESMNAGEKQDVTNFFKQADLLYLRDNNSYELVKEKLKFTNSLCLGGDLAFLDLSYYEEFIHRNKTANSLSNISFSGKHWWGDSRAEFYAQQLIPLIEKYNSIIHLLPGHMGSEQNDNKFHELLKKYLPAQNCQLHSWDKPEDFLQILSQMDFHFGNRLHSIILADILGVPNIGISNYPSKISNYINKTEMLSRERIADFMELLTIERIEKIFQEYKRPEEFIINESKTSQAGLERIFHI
ncbi:polysaccharide pyruvyl transferase family protein [Anabaena cylindrica UHCC 0172]|uniref:polysaccharide pyruvyl transferase family protein n=1 Tax=Anabaena cylindrica TaxID=1165 RepID=UPI002B217CBE|nr:polysaccharide pyruvyl transferase family protein [Anabaena cylindrica]MEA5552320.1 polysaccharide pyruvyl transferase family protein [Anabaena cylindrica UHCC 0172]